MSAPILKRVIPSHERHVTFGFVLSAGVLSSSSLVMFNMRQHDSLTLIVLTSFAALAVIATVVRLLILKVREASFRRANDSYVGVMVKARRDREAAEIQRQAAWEKSRAHS